MCRTSDTADISGESAETRETSANGQSEGYADLGDDGEAMKVRRVIQTRVISPSNDDFESVLRNAESGPKDDRRKLQVKSDDQLGTSYFKAYHSSQQRRLQKSYGRWQKQKERQQQRSSDDWRKILYLLEDATPSGEEHFKKRLDAVDLPKSVSVAFKGNAGAAILEIMQRTGCHVQVGGGTFVHSWPAGVREPVTSINLLGTPQANAAALKILPRYFDVIGPEDDEAIKILNDLSLHSPDKAYWDEQDTLSEAEVEKLDHVVDKITNPSNLTVRAIWAQDRVQRRPAFASRRFLQRPRFWTTATLTEYVERLTQKRPRLIMKSIYRQGQDARSYVAHIELVTEELEALLTTPGAIKELTAPSLNLALHYLTKHSKLHVFRKIFASLEHNGYEFAASNWNTLLAAAAKAGDVFNFRYIVGLMLDRKVTPTSVTWALLHDLMSRRFPLEAGIVVETMRRKGMLVSHEASQLVAANAVSNELTAHLAMKGELESFYTLYDNRFGLSYGRSDFDWLNINVVNRMAGVLLAAGKVQDAFSVLQDYLKKRATRGQRPALETATLNIFLTSALRDRNPATVLAMLHRFRISQPGAIIPDHITYSILFSIAWRQKHYNMLRVIWRYACAAGHVGNMMRTKIETSMLFQLPKKFSVVERGGFGQMWMTFAAKFAVGLHDQSPLNSIELHDIAASPAVKLTTFETSLVRLASHEHVEQDSPEHEEFRNEVEDIVKQDFARLHEFEPVLPFPDVLEEAFEKDMEWMQKGIGGPQGVLVAGGIKQIFMEMLQKGVKVPTRAGDYTREARPWEVPHPLNYQRSLESKAAA